MFFFTSYIFYRIIFIDFFPYFNYLIFLFLQNSKYFIKNFLYFFLQIEPLQSSFSVAALLGDKLQQKAKTNMNIKKSNNGTTRPGLPPTPQPSDSEEDEPLRKRRSMEQCELAKVSIDKDFFCAHF